MFMVNEWVNIANTYLELQTTSSLWMFGETTIFHVKIWNHPIETGWPWSSRYTPLSGWTLVSGGPPLKILDENYCWDIRISQGGSQVVQSVKCFFADEDLRPGSLDLQYTLGVHVGYKLNGLLEKTIVLVEIYFINNSGGLLF